MAKKKYGIDMTADEWFEIEERGMGEPFTARQGKWIGAKVGVFCVTPNEGNRGWADVDWFRMTK